MATANDKVCKLHYFHMLEQNQSVFGKAIDQ